MKKLHLIIHFFVITLLLSACTQGNVSSSANSTSNQTPINSAPSPSATTVISPSPTPNATNNQCRQDPLAGVYNPQRLEIKEPCKTVTGTVDKVTHEKDGDYHINLKLDPEFADLINDKNVSGEHGNLVVEIIPLDEPKIPAPKKGQHIKVTGSYVLDKHHGWLEIHPAWIINDKGSVDFKTVDAKISADSPSDEDDTSDQPKTTETSQSIPEPTIVKSSTNDQTVYYQNCTAVRAAGKAPLHKGDPGYNSKLDRDGDGIA
ncbi:MAG: calcium-binding protein, partial [Bacilli bacterium]|nr:calcium-binding protein [Bacilli bacterium]